MITLLVSLALAATCPTVRPATSFSVGERSLAWTTTLDVSTGGSISGDMWSWNPKMTYTTADGAVVATASKSTRFLSGVHIDVYDCNGSLVGSLQERLFPGLTYSTIYDILDAHGQIVATSGKFGWFDTTFVMKDPQGQTIATLNRPSHLFGGDTWYVTVAKPGIIDPRILVVTAAFKTEADAHEADD